MYIEYSAPVVTAAVLNFWETRFICRSGVIINGISRCFLIVKLEQKNEALGFFHCYSRRIHRIPSRKAMDSVR